MELAGARTTVGTGTGSDFGWSRDLNVPHYSKLGVGVYRLHVITFVDGQRCAAIGYIDIVGRAPLTTVAGGLATLITLVGFGALLAGLLRAGGRPLRTTQAFSAEDPLRQFDSVDTPGNYVGWAEVACDVGARSIMSAAPTADDVHTFLEQERYRDLLGDIASKGVRARVGDRSTLPRLRWRPRVFVVQPFVGTLTALAILTYLQQSGTVYPTAAHAAAAVLAGIVAGLLVANTARLVGAGRLNRRLKKAEQGLEVEAHEPRYPPIDDRGDLDTFVWTPTHQVPDNGAGVPAWDTPDRGGEPVATLDPGLPVKVVEERDGLTQVVCSNGWAGWTEADQLIGLDT